MLGVTRVRAGIGHAQGAVGRTWEVVAARSVAGWLVWMMDQL
jgi:hypothetical protein